MALPDVAPGPDARLARILSRVTFLCSAAILVAPKTLASSAGMTDRGSRVIPSTDPLIRAIGAGDLVSVASMLPARPGRPLRAAHVARATADVGEAGLFGALPHGAGGKPTNAGFVAVW